MPSPQTGFTQICVPLVGARSPQSAGNSEAWLFQLGTKDEAGAKDQAGGLSARPHESNRTENPVRCTPLISRVRACDRVLSCLQRNLKSASSPAGCRSVFISPASAGESVELYSRPLRRGTRAGVASQSRSCGAALSHLRSCGTADEGALYPCT